MPKPDGRTAYLDRPRVALGHVAGPCGHGVGEGQWIRGQQVTTGTAAFFLSIGTLLPVRSQNRRNGDLRRSLPADRPRLRMAGRPIRCGGSRSVQFDLELLRCPVRRTSSAWRCSDYRSKAPSTQRKTSTRISLSVQWHVPRRCSRLPAPTSETDVIC